jgi:alpha-galactosidase
MLSRKNESGRTPSDISRHRAAGYPTLLITTIGNLDKGFLSSLTPARHSAWLLLVSIALLFPIHASALNNGLASTPPMGWNSWNHFGCSGLNEAVIEQTASAMATNGMKTAGYVYVNLDDCWMASSRDANGNLIPDPASFPGGMPALVSYVHNLGLKIGLYEDVGTATCQGRPGSYGHYQQDANTFASWGIDYIKMDWCNNTGLDPATQYAQFAQALTAAKGNTVFSICDWGMKMPWIWAPALGNSWRTTPDISDNWLSMINNLEATSAFAASAGPGAWNDPDMLEVGNGGMTDTEYRAHFSMWAMLAAPLISGNDLTNMTANTLSTLTNPEVIAIDQDALGKQGILLSDNGSGLQVWSKQITGNTVVALLNQSGLSSILTVNWSDIGLDPAQTATVRDLWAHADLGAFSNSFSTAVPSHGVMLIKIGASGTTPTQTVYEADAGGNTLSGAAVAHPCPGTFGYSCLDGNDVGWIGNGASNSVTINDVNVATSETYNMTIYAAVSGTRLFDVSVNGSAATPVSVTGTSFSVPSTSGLRVQLNAGSNTIQFSNPTAYAPDLDHIVLSSPGAVTSGFNIAYPIQNVTITSRGQSGAALIALVPTGGFTGKVMVNCALPAAMTGATCSSASAEINGTVGAVASLVITTTAPSTAALRHGSAAGGRAVAIAGKSAKQQSSNEIYHWLPVLSATFLPIFGLALVVFFVLKGPRVRKPTILLLPGIVSIGLLLIVACQGVIPVNQNGSFCSGAPSAPAGLAASSTTSSGTTLTWTASSQNTNCAVTGYSVYQNSVLIATTASNSYAVTGLSPSTTYSFTIAANDAFGVSASSSAVSITTAAAIAGSPTPAGIYHVAVTATSGSITQNSNFQVIVQ